MENEKVEKKEKKKFKIKEKDVFVVKIIAYVILTLLALCSILPFFMLVSASFSSEKALSLYGYGFFPREFSVESYKYVFAAGGQIGKAYLITIGVTIIGTVLSVMITSMFAYGLMQKDLPGKSVIMIIMIITMLFNGGIVSSYIIWKNYIHIDNNIAAYIFPNLLMNGFNVILVLSYYRSSVATELLEAARMDGANEMFIYLRIMLPLSTPILATIGLMSALMYWNDWTNGLYYINNKDLYSVQLLLNRMNQSVDFLASNPNVGAMLGDAQLPTTSVRMTIALVGVLPILIAYPFFQKYFAAGLTLGGVKG